MGGVLLCGFRTRRVGVPELGVGISPGILIELGDTLMALRHMNASVYRISIN